LELQTPEKLEKTTNDSSPKKESKKEKKADLNKIKIEAESSKELKSQLK